MKRNPLFWVLACALFICLHWKMPVYGDTTDRQPSMASDQLQQLDTSIDFVQFRTLPNTTVRDVWEIVSELNLTIVRVETAYTMGDREWFDTLYSPDAASEEELTNQIIDARREIWENLIDGNDWKLDEAYQYEAGLDFLGKDDDELPPPIIFSVMLRGDRDQLRIASGFLSENRELHFVSDMVQKFVDEHVRDEKTTAAPANETWLPENGYVATGPSSTSGYRYVTQKLWWDDKSGFKASGDYSTYEHEFFLYNYPDSYSGTYLNELSTPWPNCYPALKSSSQNFPAEAYAYLDTRITYYGACLSHYDQVEFTAGLVFASKVVTYTTYTGTMVVANGKTSTDQFLLKGQIGYCPYSASTCASYLTWGVYGQVHDYIQPDNGSWDHTVPGTKSWYE